MPDKPVLIVDGHLDMAYNATFHRRDLTQTVQVLREREDGAVTGMSAHPDSLERRKGPEVHPPGTVTVGHDKGKSSKPVAGEPAPEAAPEAFGLDQCYPNPFNPATTIRYALPEGSNVSLVVYNLLGQQVRTLVSGAQGPGYHTAVWDGRDEAGRMAATGVYIYRLQAGGFSQVKKMLFAK